MPKRRQPQTPVGGLPGATVFVNQAGRGQGCEGLALSSTLGITRSELGSESGRPSPAATGWGHSSPPLPLTPLRVDGGAFGPKSPPQGNQVT